MASPDTISSLDEVVILEQDTGEIRINSHFIKGNIRVTVGNKKNLESRMKVKIGDYLGPDYAEILDPFINEGKLGYIAKTLEGKWLVNYGGTEGQQHEQIVLQTSRRNMLFAMSNPAFSFERGAHEVGWPSIGFLNGKLTYIVANGDGKQSVQVFNEFSGPEFNQVRSLCEIAGNLAYIATKDKGDVLVIDGKEQVSMEGMQIYAGIFRVFDGKPAYAIKVPSKGDAMVFGNEISNFYTSVNSPVLFEGKVGFIAGQNGKKFVVQNGVEGEHFDYINYLKKVGGNLVYIAANGNSEKGWNSWVIINGEKGPMSVNLIDEYEVFKGLPFYKIFAKVDHLWSIKEVMGFKNQKPYVDMKLVYGKEIITKRS